MASNFELIFQIGAQLASSMGSSFNAANSHLNNLTAASDAARQKLDGFRSAGMSALAVAGTMAAGLGLAANEAIKFESAFAEVKKVAQGTPQELAALNAEIIKMSTRLPMAATEIAAIMAAGAQSGIAMNELVQFGESAVKMGIAFDITADQAGQAMAEMRAAFKLTQPEVETLGHQINALSNNSTQTAAKLTEVVQRVGSLGELAGYTGSDIAAMAATLVSVEPDVAATGIKNLTLALVKGESATNSQKEAFKALGLDYNKISAGMIKDARGTTLEVVRQLGGIQDAGRLAIINELFGSEALNVVGQMYNNQDKLVQMFALVDEEAKKNTSMWDEYAGRAETTENALTLLKESVVAIAIDLGNVLLPAINAASQAMMQIIAAVRDWAAENPKLFNSLVIGAVVVTALVGAFGALAVGIWAIAGPVTTAITLIKAVGTAIMFVGKMMLMNPIGLAITAIVAAIVLAITYHEEIKAVMFNVWSSITNFLGQAWTSIKSFFSSGIANITATILSFSPLGLFARAFSAVLSWFGVELPAKFTGFGRMLIQGLINGIASMAGAVMAKARGIADAITSTVKGAFNIHSPSRVFAEIGKYNMQGLAQGMDKNAMLPQKSANAAALNTVPDLRKGLASSASGGVFGGGSVNITQNITVQGGGAGVYEQAKKGASDGAADLMQQLAEIRNYNSRVSYG